MISTFTVLIDANVFYGARLRSLVLFLAQTKMFRARWTERINDEWMRNVADKNSIAMTQLGRTRDLMSASVLDGIVSGYEILEASFGQMPDADDRHVLAAAVKTRADIILTFNTKDFPEDILRPLGIKTRHPDVFFQDLFDISSSLFAEAVRLDFQHYTKPRLGLEDYVASLEKAGVGNTAKLIAELRVLIEEGHEQDNASDMP